MLRRAGKQKIDMNFHLILLSDIYISIWQVKLLMVVEALARGKATVVGMAQPGTA